MILLYSFVLLFFPILGFLSRRETVFTTEQVSALQMPFEKMAIHLYRGLLRRPSLRYLRAAVRPQGVLEDLRTLDRSQGAERREHAYFVRKIRLLLIFVFLSDCMAVLLWIFPPGGSASGEITAISRPDFGDSAVTAEITATDEGGRKETFLWDVQAREPTEQEVQALAEEVFRILEEKLPADNQSLRQVSGDISMPSRLSGYPFRIVWYSSRIPLVDSNGTVNNEELSEGTGENVTLTAVLVYKKRQYEREFRITVVPKQYSEEEIFRREIEEALAQEQEKTAGQEEFVLPDAVNGQPVVWTEVKEDPSVTAFFFLLFLGIVCCRMEDQKLHSRIEKRSRQLQLDYPQMLSRLVLYMGAGLSARGSFARMGEAYLIQREKGGKTQYVYEEILILCHELESGVSEADAYCRFGQRCGLLSYSRFCSLLGQNLRKGNSTLLLSLRDESDRAFTERKNVARQMGEEAGTRLLFPMILMLIITMVIIIIPAYSSFHL